MKRRNTDGADGIFLPFVNFTFWATSVHTLHLHLTIFVVVVVVEVVEPFVLFFQLHISQRVAYSQKLYHHLLVWQPTTCICVGVWVREFFKNSTGAYGHFLL